MATVHTVSALRLPTIPMRNQRVEARMTPNQPRHCTVRTKVQRFAVIAAVSIWSIATLSVAGCAVSRIRTSAELAKRSEPFQIQPANATRRVLVVGDSTAVGTGATSAGTSVPGLLSADHPTWSIVNHARDGAKFEGVVDQLPSGEKFDLVLVMAGGNDVIRLTGSEELASAVRSVAERARAIAPRVILMPCGNVGNAPFFYAPWSWWMTRRSQELREIVRTEAARTGAAYVDLYLDRPNDPFAREPDRMNAPDHLHPSDAGYALWYESLKRDAALQAVATP